MFFLYVFFRPVIFKKPRYIVKQHLQNQFLKEPEQHQRKLYLGRCSATGAQNNFIMAYNFSKNKKPGINFRASLFHQKQQRLILLCQR